MLINCKERINKTAIICKQNINRTIISLNGLLQLN